MKKCLSNPRRILKAVYIAVPVLLFSVPTFAQKKTLGVGVVSPNPNAALHVESPTNDQGFIMPRLTTAQRTASTFTSALTAADNGLLVYDSELQTLFVWNGTAWSTPSKFAFPYKDSTATMPFGSAMLDLNYKGENASDSVTTAVFKNSATNNKGAAVSVEKTSGGGLGLYVLKSSPVGGGTALFTEAKSGNGIFANTYGTNGYAGIFQNINTSNPAAALYSEALGNGPSLWALKSADGLGDGPAIVGEHYMTNGSAGIFAIANTANPKAALVAETNGSGAGIYAENSGSGDGFAGNFRLTSATNNYPAVQASTKGTGSSFRAFQSSTDGTGHGIDVYMQNTSSNGAGIWVDQQGKGSAGFFNVNNTTTTVPALDVTTNSINSYAIKGTSTGNDAAGYFVNTNASSNASAMVVMSNSANGTGVGALNLANGNGLAIWQGGLHVSTTTLASGGSITTRATAYLITGGGPYTFGFTLTDGDTFYFYNSTVSAVTVAGTSVPADAGKVFIVLGGVARGF